MKKIVAIAVIGAAMSLSACAHKQAVDYGYEKQAPYSSDRTVGTTTTTKGDTVFKSAQKK